MPSSIEIPLFAVRHKEIGGTEFAIYNLIKGLAQTEIKTRISYDSTKHLSPEFGQWLKNANVEQKRRLSVLGPKNVRFLQETIFEWSRNARDWVLYPNYFIPPRRRFEDFPSSAILHDIQYKLLPDYHSTARKIWLDYYLPKMFQRAESVVLISHSEKQFVERFFGSKNAEKCDVVYNAIDWDRFEQENCSPPNPRLMGLLDKPYILTVCHQFPHKNLKTLLIAFEQLIERHDIYLYMVGVDSPSNLDFIANQLSPKARDRVKLLGFLSDLDLGSMYKRAMLFVMPSLYEGFGMPAVEALGMGTPILVSGTTALPETTMGMGSYVKSPEDAAEWIAQINELLISGKRPSPDDIAQLRTMLSPVAAAQTLLSALRSRGFT